MIKYIRMNQIQNQVPEIKTLMYSTTRDFVSHYSKSLMLIDPYDNRFKTFIHICPRIGPSKDKGCDCLEGCIYIEEIGKIFYCECVDFWLKCEDYVPFDFLDELVEVKNGGELILLWNHLETSKKL